MFLFENSCFTTAPQHFSVVNQTTEIQYHIQLFLVNQAGGNLVVSHHLTISYYFRGSKIRCIHHASSSQVSSCCKKPPHPAWSRRNETREGQVGEKRDLSQPALLDHSPSSSHNACYSNHGCDIRSPNASLSQHLASFQIMTRFLKDCE